MGVGTGRAICLWFDKDAVDAARFYAATFPESEVTAIHEAPSDFPGGKKGDVLTVEFTVLGIPCQQRRRGKPMRLVQGPLGPLLGRA